MDSRVEAVLGVDDYLSRVYSSESALAGLYIGFYQTQRQGNAIHSPMNCLPGAGWEPIDRAYISIPVARTAGTALNENIQINRVIIEKGLQRQVALYWSQAHGRVVASEYSAKIYTVLDAMRMNRTDGALVRVICPVTRSGHKAEDAAQNVAVEFVQSIFPLLSHYLPD